MTPPFGRDSPREGGEDTGQWCWLMQAAVFSGAHRTDETRGPSFVYPCLPFLL